MTSAAKSGAVDRSIHATWLAMSCVGLAAIPWIIWTNRARDTIVGFDGYATWAMNANDLYGIPYMDLGAFRYTPAYAQAFSWAGQLPWEIFAAAWIGASAVILVLWGRWWALALVGFPPVALELYHGNIHLLMAAATVVGFRYPAAWAFPILAKVTPGIALLWFVGRREWQNLAVAAGATGLIVAVSAVAAPDLWRAWVTAMSASLTFVPPRPYPIDIPFAIRALVAGALSLWGGHTNRRWTVPVAAAIGSPIVWVHTLSMLVGIVPLLALDVRSRPSFGNARGAVRPGAPRTWSRCSSRAGWLSGTGRIFATYAGSRLLDVATRQPKRERVRWRRWFSSP